MVSYKLTNIHRFVKKKITTLLFYKKSFFAKHIKKLTSTKMVLVSFKGLNPYAKLFGFKGFL